MKVISNLGYSEMLNRSLETGSYNVVGKFKNSNEYIGIPLLFDSHAHLTNPTIFDQIDSVLSRAKEVGVHNIMNICTDPLSLQRGLELADRNPWILQAAATTPHDVAKEGEQVFEIIAQQARKGRLQAVGETGLDYYYEHSDRHIQQHFLRRYLHLALECNLPVIIHCREAFSDLFSIIDSDYQINGRCAPGILHCFTGTQQEAEEVLKRDWMLSLSGIVTFKKSILLQQVAKIIPLEKLLIETDSPYLAPEGHRGKQNEPAFLVEIARFLSILKGISLEEMIRITSNNAKKVFKISKQS